MWVHWRVDMKMTEADRGWFGPKLIEYLKFSGEDPNVGKYNGRKFFLEDAQSYIGANSDQSYLGRIAFSFSAFATRVLPGSLVPIARRARSLYACTEVPSALQDGRRV